MAAAPRPLDPRQQHGEAGAVRIRDPGQVQFDGRMRPKQRVPALEQHGRRLEAEAAGEAELSALAAQLVRAGRRGCHWAAQGVFAVTGFAPAGAVAGPAAAAVLAAALPVCTA